MTRFAETPAIEHGAIESLRTLRNVLTGPLVEIASRFSSWAGSRFPHTALIIYTKECTGRPRKVSGEAAIISHVSIRELDDIKEQLFEHSSYVLDAPMILGGGQRRVAAQLDDSTETLLVLVPKPTTPNSTRVLRSAPRSASSRPPFATRSSKPARPISRNHWPRPANERGPSPK